jgi:hypothetical protein
MNLTLTDDQGQTIKCRLVHARRQAAPSRKLASVISRKEVILKFDTVKEATDVFRFTRHRA